METDKVIEIVEYTPVNEIINQILINGFTISLWFSIIGLTIGLSYSALKISVDK